MTAIRCPRCKRLLFKGKGVEIEIKCPKCGLLYKTADSKKNT
jgi:phage FluMu protein Com